jgi:tRNA threonylcarbamoyladenosine biosynthesis protein TsaE
MVKIMDMVSVDVKDTEKIASDLALSLRAGDLVALYGEVGAGKTTFARGLGFGLGCTIRAKSPSFSLMNEYPGDIALYHIDFYRMKNESEINDLGWTDYLDSDGVVVIEWAEKIKNSLPQERVDVYLHILGSDTRRLEIFVFDDFRDRLL